MNSSTESIPLLISQNDPTWSMCEGVTIPKCNSYIANEDHLHNLGLTVDNGKPRFKLNEPCSSLAARSICAPSNVQDYHSSQSFVVLSHPSLEAVQAQSLANYEKIQEKTASIDYGPVISSMSPSEIEHKLSEMLHENLKLKETLAENSEVMKKQFNSLATFQEEVSTVHQNHKQKFAETRELINQLKKENLELKMMQISVDQSKSLTMSPFKQTTESQSLQTSVTKFCNCSSREEELNKLLNDARNECTESKEECEKFKKELIDSKELCDGLTRELILNDARNECTESKEECEKFKKELIDSKELCDRLTRELVTCKRAPEKVIRELTESNENYQKELATCKEQCEKLSEEVGKYLCLSNLMRLQLKQNSEKSDSTPGMDKSSNSNDFIVYCPSPTRTEDSQNLIKECSEKDKEISFLRELVTSLEQQVKVMSKDAFVPLQPLEIQEPTESQIPPSEVRQQLIQGIKVYSEKMEALVDCFSLQSSRYVRIQEYLKKCSNISYILETSLKNEDSAMDNSALATYRNILGECRKKLMDEQLENIVERQKWIKAQDQLQKIFSDYKSALYELEIIQEENKKLKMMDIKIAEERLHQVKDLEELLAEKHKALEEASATIALEKLSLSEEMKSVEELRELLMATQMRYNSHLEKLEQERLSLDEEKSALDKQGKLYEAQENSLIAEKKDLLKKCEEFSERASKFEEKFIKQCKISDLDKENMMVLRAQLEIFRSDFDQEKEAKKGLIREKNKLVEQVQELTEQNYELRKDIDRLRPKVQPHPPAPQPTQHPENTNASGMIQLYSCPVCGHKFSSLEPLIEHVDGCISLIEKDN